jgi:hypothetical protein
MRDDFSIGQRGGCAFQMQNFACGHHCERKAQGFNYGAKLADACIPALRETEDK